jgi:hypothetical protein
LPLDKFGIPFLYPTKTTAGISGSGVGFFWQQNNDIHKDDDYEGNAFLRIGKEHDSSDFEVINSSTGEFQFPFTFDYDYEPSLSLSGPTGHHSGGVTHGCQGFTYMITGHWDVNPPQFRFRKETYHVQYNDHPEGKWTSPLATGPVENNWKGFGWVRYNKKDGRGPGKDSVICEAWWNDNPTADITKWVMLKRVEDKGNGVTNWGVGATCDGEAYQVGTWSNIQFRIKSSGSDFSLHPLIPEPDDGPNIHSIGEENMSFADSEARGYGKRADMPRDIEMKCLFKWNSGGEGICSFKNLSLREIDPTLSFEDDPTVPEPGEEPTETSLVQGVFRFKWDINHLRTSPCAGAGGGGSGGSAVFYTISADHDTELSNTSTFQNRTRGGEQCSNSSSPIYSKLIKQLDVPLKKVGTPGATPVINAKIWASNGTVLYTSPTTIAPNSLTTSYTTQSFNFSTNTHLITTGDVVGVEYITTSSTNYVVFGYGDNTVPNTVYVNRESGAWEPKPTTRDFACTMWT